LVSGLPLAQPACAASTREAQPEHVGEEPVGEVTWRACGLEFLVDPAGPVDEPAGRPAVDDDRVIAPPVLVAELIISPPDNSEPLIAGSTSP
jgi:hypothetical protein